MYDLTWQMNNLMFCKNPKFFDFLFGHERICKFAIFRQNNKLLIQPLKTKFRRMENFAWRFRFIFTKKISYDCFQSLPSLEVIKSFCFFFLLAG